MKISYGGKTLFSCKDGTIAMLAGGSLSLRSAAFSSTRPPFRQGYSRNLIDIQQLMKESSLFWQRAFFIAGNLEHYHPKAPSEEGAVSEADGGSFIPLSLFHRSFH